MDFTTDALLGALSIMFFIWGAICLGSSLILRKFRHPENATAGTTSVSIAMLISLII
ncbi:hypothetical protein [Pleionea sediminis]|uniref:hypothetical protein n=1 Tax=Pleionea sediminis TaxID=2569479 RepID=UPI0013DD9E63|nr:hypothetical protein [Pleionea sediminis]